jgi:hypothetical protein
VVQRSSPTPEDGEAFASDGWAPVARACAKILTQIDIVSERVAGAVVDEVEAYQAVPFSEIQMFVRVQGSIGLVGLAERRPPTEEVKQAAFAVGQDRARAGFPLDAITSGLQVGFREWMKEVVPLIPARESHLLVEAITIMWAWFHQASESAAQGYSSESNRRSALMTQTRERFVDALRRWDVAADELRQLSRRLGFDPEGRFRVAWSRTSFDQELLTSLFENVDGVSHAVNQGLDVIVVTQAVDVDQVERILAAVSGSLGIGLARPGLEGAHASMIDAELSVDLAEATGASPIRFERDWLRAVLLARRSHLAPLLEPGIDAFREHPHIAEAALVFSASGFRQSEAARKLHLRPNSLNYRLQRWKQLTGQDVSTSEGVAYIALSSICAKE